MVDNNKLKARLAPKLKGLHLTEEQQDQLIKEMNYISDLVIDSYLSRRTKRNGELTGSKLEHF